MYEGKQKIRFFLLSRLQNLAFFFHFRKAIACCNCAQLVCIVNCLQPSILDYCDKKDISLNPQNNPTFSYHFLEKP